MMEENFRPRGGLGIIKCDLKHTEFFYEEQFDDNFETLINEINAIEVGLGMRTSKETSEIVFISFFFVQHVATVSTFVLVSMKLSLKIS